jgi:hypothetical protein
MAPVMMSGSLLAIDAMSWALTRAVALSRMQSRVAASLGILRRREGAACIAVLVVGFIGLVLCFFFIVSIVSIVSIVWIVWIVWIG